MVADIPKLGMIRANEFEDNPIGLIHPKAPDFVVFGMQLLGSERRMKGIALEEICSLGCLMLNEPWEFLEEAIECGGSRDLDHQPPNRLAHVVTCVWLRDPIDGLALMHPGRLETLCGRDRWHYKRIQNSPY